MSNLRQGRVCGAVLTDCRANLKEVSRQSLAVDAPDSACNLRRRKTENVSKGVGQALGGRMRISCGLMSVSHISISVGADDALLGTSPTKKQPVRGSWTPPTSSYVFPSDFTASPVMSNGVESHGL